MDLELATKIGVILIGLSNLILGIFVFKFNFKKDNFSKVSLKALKIKSIDNDTSAMDRTVKSLVDLKYVNDINDQDVHFNSLENGGSYRFGARNGYCTDSLLHEMYDWFFEVQNKGSFPSTNIEIEYEIDIYKLDARREEDGMIGFQMNPDVTVKRSVHIDYIAADETKKVFISTLNGEFPHARITVLKLKSSQMSYIKKNTQIDTYTHPKLMNSAHIDSNLFAKLAGIVVEKNTNKLRKRLEERSEQVFYVKKDINS